jgi:thymidine kinase
MPGEFTLILGPMASGKSRTLITEIEKYDIANKNVVAVHPVKNVRDTHVESRNGQRWEAIKLGKLTELSNQSIYDKIDVIGVDEAFMFDAEDVRQAFGTWLKDGKIIVASSLDMAGNGTMPEPVIRMLEFAPNVKYERAVCTTCDDIDARYTLIFNTTTNEPLKNLPDVVPDDGTYGYRPVCRNCYFGWAN